MLKLLGYCIKIALFTVIVLILGNWVRWDGKTISDQIKVRMSHAEKSGVFDEARTWTEKLTLDAKKGIQKKLNQVSNQVSIEEDIPASEKQKLKALIRELNSSHKKD